MEQLYGMALALQVTNCTPIPNSGAGTAPDHLDWKVSRLAVHKAVGRISVRAPHDFDVIPAGIVKTLGAQSREQLAQRISLAPSKVTQSQKIGFVAR